MKAPEERFRASQIEAPGAPNTEMSTVSKCAGLDLEEKTSGRGSGGRPSGSRFGGQNQWENRPPK